MKLKQVLLFKKLIMYSFYGILAQFICFTFLLASEGSKAQSSKSVKDIMVNLTFENDDLTTVFNKIEKKTDLTFVFNKRDVSKSKIRISKKYSEGSIYEVLLDISKQADLSFKQVNRNINVKKSHGNLEETNRLVVIARDVDVSGKITDENNAGLPGASVVVDGTTTGTTSDLNGNYKLSAPDGATLTISFVGYKTQQITVGSQSVIDIQMEVDANILGEVVVVTAMGIERQERSVGYAVQSVKAIDVLASDPVDISQGLQGKVAGLNISTANGLNNASSRVVIRGNNSLFGKNQPIIVVDGAIVENNELPQGNVGTNQDGYRDWGNYLSYLDMSTVENVSILKGPNAAALYGARGANGVILITSKKGSKRKGVGIQYSTSSNFTEVNRFSDVQNEFGGGFRAALYTANPQLPKTGTGQSFVPVLYNGNVYPGQTGIESSHGVIPGGYNTPDVFSWFGAGGSWGSRMDGTPALYWDGQIRPYSPHPDNRKYMYKTGMENTHNVSFSSASDLGSIRLGISTKKGDAVVENTDYKSTSASLGSHINISKIFSADVTANYNQNSRLNAPEIGNNNSWSKFMIYGMSRDYIGIEKDLYYGEDDYDGYRVNFGGAYPHAEYSRDLFWYTYQNNSRLWRDEFISTIKLNATITPWLNAFVRTSVDLIGTRFEATNNTIQPDGLNGGSFARTISKDKIFNTDVMAIFHKDDFITDGFNASVTLGYNEYSNNSAGIQSLNNNPFKVPNIYALSNHGTITNQDRINELAKESRYDVQSYSYFGLMDLSYKNFLFLQLTGRRDANSTLPENNNTTFYPSMNTSFVFTDAFDLGNASDLVSYGAFRFAYGKSANATEPYQLDAVYETGSFGGQTTITRPATIPPNDLTFQTSKSTEVGMALGLFKNIVNVDFTYYNIKSENQIMTSALALSAGASKVIFNSGVLTNKGIEMVIKADIFHTDNFSWNVSLNAAKNTNKVVSLAEGVEEQQIATVFSSQGAYMKASPGENYGVLYGTDFELDDQGRKQVMNIYNKDGSGEVIGTQYKVTADVQPIGNAAPKMTGGLGNVFGYKNFRLSTLIDYKLGGDIYSVDHAVSMGSGLAPETAAARNGGGLPYTYPDGTTDDVGMVMEGYNVDDERENDRVIHPVYYYGITYAGWSHLNRPRSLSVFENSWIKLREVSLTYNFPRELLSKTNFIQNASLSVVGRNLFYLYTTLPDHLNPEAINGTGNGQGLQWSAFPSMRTIGFNLKIGF
ncbi:SusC/RagA family TonB-linked outer membrane protein [Reichenbachiella sp. MALMAid0571]|uniref:SusC/RagA family TonB-linked outer membrane protein n=1 Tax=Reichenbachiella sp. MALMAid0571 TaxID=3143939 RepID=UPI0032DFAE18